MTLTVLDAATLFQTWQGPAAGSSQRRAARRGPLEGRTVVVVGAGGAGRALAFGAADRGAQVRIRCSGVGHTP